MPCLQLPMTEPPVHNAPCHQTRRLPRSSRWWCLIPPLAPRPAIDSVSRYYHLLFLLALPHLAIGLSPRRSISFSCRWCCHSCVQDPWSHNQPGTASGGGYLPRPAIGAWSRGGPADSAYSRRLGPTSMHNVSRQTAITPDQQHPLRRVRTLSSIRLRCSRLIRTGCPHDRSAFRRC
jgi:hypothetical protein